MSHLTWHSASVERTWPRVSRIHRPVGATRIFPDGATVFVPLRADSVACIPSKRLTSSGTKSSPKSCRDTNVWAQLGLASVANSEVVEDVSNVFSYLSGRSIINVAVHIVNEVNVFRFWSAAALLNPMKSFSQHSSMDSRVPRKLI